MSDRPERGRSAAPDLARGLSLAFEFAGAVALFWFIGRLVDGWLGTEPWAQVVGALFGWVGGFLHVYYSVQRLDFDAGKAASKRGAAGLPKSGRTTGTGSATGRSITTSSTATSTTDGNVRNGSSNGASNNPKV